MLRALAFVCFWLVVLVGGVRAYQYEFYTLPFHFLDLNDRYVLGEKYDDYARRARFYVWDLRTHDVIEVTRPEGNWQARGLLPGSSARALFLRGTSYPYTRPESRIFSLFDSNDPGVVMPQPDRYVYWLDAVDEQNAVGYRRAGNYSYGYILRDGQFTEWVYPGTPYGTVLYKMNRAGLAYGYTSYGNANFVLDTETRDVLVYSDYLTQRKVTGLGEDHVILYLDSTDNMADVVDLRTGQTLVEDFRYPIANERFYRWTRLEAANTNLDLVGKAYYALGGGYYQTTEFVAVRVDGPAPVPEPSTGVLGFVGLLGAGWWVRRRRGPKH